MFYDDETVGRKAFRSERKRNGKKRNHKRKPWQQSGHDFRCAHCKRMILATDGIGTAHRNHCPFCLHSRHVDTKPGNRASTCHARMTPVGLTARFNGQDKYGRPREDDVMLVHLCSGCGTVNVNRIAGDDSCEAILNVFIASQSLADSARRAVEAEGITLLCDRDSERLHVALFGKRRRSA